MSKEKIIVCHADICIHNDDCGRCCHDYETVQIAIYDGLAQCVNYEAKKGIISKKKSRFLRSV